MILYSIIPAEIVFKDYSEQIPLQFIEAEYLGNKVQVVQSAANEFVISRVLSTEPKTYLDPRLQPGTVVRDIKIV